MDWDKTIDELKRAWDALEELPVKGYQTRARINMAQEMILSCYNEVIRAKKNEEHDEDAAKAAE